LGTKANRLIKAINWSYSCAPWWAMLAASLMSQYPRGYHSGQAVLTWACDLIWGPGHRGILVREMLGLSLFLARLANLATQLLAYLFVFLAF